ncbi:unnamed protein product, partial [Prorocentrum cordatum]
MSGEHPSLVQECQKFFEGAAKHRFKDALGFVMKNQYVKLTGHDPVFRDPMGFLGAMRERSGPFKLELESRSHDGATFLDVELNCLVPGLAADDFPPLAIGVRPVPKTRRRSEAPRRQPQTPRAGPGASPRAPRASAPPPGPPPAAPEVVPRLQMVEFCADAGATDAIGGSATEAAEAATWGRSSAAPENRAEMQARKNMRVLDLLGAGGSKAAQELISNISIFSQKLSQK